MPLAQLASVGNLGGAARRAAPDALRDYVGKRLPLKVIEADQRRDRLILSEKAAAQQIRRRRKEQASSQLEEGQVLDGTTRERHHVGVFDVGFADGLVHRYRRRPRAGRISLAIKRLEEDPCVRAARDLAVGTEVDATVTRVMPYGAFARVTKGLIHISEIAPRRIATQSEVVQPGDLFRVRVVAIDPDRRRLSLSVRQAVGTVVYATRTDQDANV